MSGFLRNPVGGWSRWKKVAPGDFWMWFQTNSWRLRLYDSEEQEGVLDELQRRLDLVSRGLTFELGGGPENEDILLAISADGRQELFRSVQELVAVAPQVPGFRIVAFRQRKDAPFEVSLGDIHLSPAQTYFRAEPVGDRVRLTLFIEGLTPETRPGLEGAARLVLDDVLGEFDAGTRLAGITVKPAPEEPEREGLRPLAELASVIDAR